jgi:Flp pilus assembly CpaE family ATPase
MMILGTHGGCGSTAIALKTSVSLGRRSLNEASETSVILVVIGVLGFVRWVDQLT